MDNNFVAATDPYAEIIERELSRELAIRPVDLETGEVMEYSLEQRVDSLSYSIRTGVLPLHLQMLEKLSVDDDRKEELLSWYDGVAPRSFDSYINKEISVQGSIIREYPAFRSFKDKSLQEGYFKVMLLLENKDEDGNFIVLSTSGRTIGEQMIFALKNKGWYIWDKAATYRITKAGSGAFGMLRVPKKGNK